MRYERPEGREREFWQLNADMFGAAGPAANTKYPSRDIMEAFGAKDDIMVSCERP